MAVAGVSDVYSVSNDLLKAFLGIDIARSQVYRVTDLLGEQLTQDLAQPVCHLPVESDQIIYAFIDGSMILTDDGCGAARAAGGEAKPPVFQPKSGGKWTERR